MISYDAGSQASGTSVSSFSWNHTMGAGGTLVVAIFSNDAIAGSRAVSSVKYGGVALTKGKSCDNGSNCNVELWYLHGAPVGTAAVSAVMGGSNTWLMGIGNSLLGVSAQAPEANCTGVNATGGTASGIITTITSGAWVIDGVIDRTGATATPLAGQTTRATGWTGGAGPKSWTSTRATAGPSAITDGWTGSLGGTENLVMVALAFAPDTAPASTVLEILTTGATGYSDYSGYMYTGNDRVGLQRSWPLNGPQTLTVFLKETAGFVAPTRHNPIRFSLAAYGSSAQVFTGYIVNDPEKAVFAQETDGVVRNIWKLICIDETYSLDIAAGKEFHRIPPLRGMTVGQIVKYLLDLLRPGYFDVTNVDDGIVIPSYEITLDMNFTDVIRDLVEPAGMKFWTRAGKAFLKYLNDAASDVTIDQTSADYNPDMLSIFTQTAPIFNDVIAFGGPMPEAYVRDYFVGDGLTMRFPLSNRVHGTKKSVILTDDLSSANDSGLWSKNDPTSVMANGVSLYVDGGAGYGVTYLVARSSIELAGTLLFQHGAIRFTDASSGIIGGMWASGAALQPSSCFSGFLCAPSGVQTTISVLVSGSAPAGATSLVTQAGYDYILQTLIQCPERLRRGRPSFSLNTPTGFGATTFASNAWMSMKVLRVSQSDPSSPPTAFQLYAGTASGSPGFISYAPFNSVNLNIAANFLFVTTPVDVLAMTKPATSSGFITYSLGAEKEIDKDGAIVAGQAGNSDLGLFGTGLSSQAPASGDALEVRYRAASPGAVRVMSSASQTSEASSMRDSGVRAKILTDVGFDARDESELEWAAKAFMDDHLAPVYQGTFVFDTFKRPLTADIVPGRFVTVLATGMYPSFQAMITQVDMDYVKQMPNGTDIVEYTVSFGTLETFEKLKDQMAKLDTGSVVPQEETAAVNPIDFGSVGTGFAPNVPDMRFTYVYGSTYFQIDFGAPPPTGAGGDSGHYEVRYSDSGWGIPSGQNLIMENATQVGNMPRNSRRQQLWARAVQPVNLALHSSFEDGVNYCITSGTKPPTATWVSGVGATDFFSMRTAWPTGGEAYGYSSLRFSNTNLPAVPSGVTFGYRFKVKTNRALTGSEALAVAPVSYNPDGAGLAGVVLNATNITSGTYSTWQEFSASVSGFGTAQNVALQVYINGGGGTLTSPLTAWFDDLQIEKNSPPSANPYFKTTTSPKGFVSRLSSLVFINWPLPPQPLPSASIDGTDRFHPKVTFALPNNAMDVFGIMVSGASGILYDYSDLSLALSPDDPALTFTFDNSASGRTANVTGYTYNLLREFSSALVVNINMPAVVPSGLSVNTSGQLVLWTPNPTAKFFEVTVSPSSDFSSPKATGIVAGYSFPLSIENVVQSRYIRVRADDGLGYGAYASGFFSYTSLGPTGFDNVANTESVGFPPSPTADPTYGNPFTPYTREMRQRAWDDYGRESGRRMS